MPVPKRYFHVSQELNLDPELWAFTDKHGDRALRTWLQVLVFLDRSENRWRLVDGWLKNLSRMVRQTPASVSRMVGEWLANGWLTILESSPDGSPLVVSSPNWSKYNKRREHKGDSPVPSMLPSYPTPTPTPTPKIKIKKEEVKKEGSAEGISETPSATPKADPAAAFSVEEIRQRWNQILGVKPCKKITEALAKKIKRLTVEHDQAWWEELFAEVSRSRFLTGKVPGHDGKRPFRVDLDWATGPINLGKILAGNYDDGSMQASSRGVM